MGNFLSCIKKENNNNLLNQCPYCNFNFRTNNEKKKHVKNCLYNSRINEMDTLFDVSNNL